MHFLKIFTFLEPSELQQLEDGRDQDPGMRLAQIRLAQEVTRLVHGEENLEAAERITEALVSNSLESLSARYMEQLAQDGMASTRIDNAEIAITDAMVESGIAMTPRGEVTLGQARKLVKGNAVSVNGVKVTSQDMVLSRDAALHGRYFILQKGKKVHHLIVLGQ